MFRKRQQMPTSWFDVERKSCFVRGSLIETDFRSTSATFGDSRVLREYFTSHGYHNVFVYSREEQVKELISAGQEIIKNSRTPPVNLVHLHITEVFTALFDTYFSPKNTVVTILDLSNGMGYNYLVVAFNDLGEAVKYKMQFQTTDIDDDN